jgi:uncharacterized protein (TIGR03435 family)
MLRVLLERRFRLSIQIEKRPMDVNVLVIADRSARKGTGLHPVAVDCESNRLKEGSGSGIFPPEARLPCNQSQRTFRLGQPGRRAKYSAYTMNDFANALPRYRGLPVVDRTGLTGQFDIELEYVSEGTLDATAATSNVASNRTSHGTSLNEALENQLGLRLRHERVQIDVLVVRSVQLPEPN